MFVGFHESAIGNGIDIGTKFQFLKWLDGGILVSRVWSAAIDSTLIFGISEKCILVSTLGSILSLKFFPLGTLHGDLEEHVEVQDYVVKHDWGPPSTVIIFKIKE